MAAVLYNTLKNAANEKVFFLLLINFVSSRWCPSCNVTLQEGHHRQQRTHISKFVLKPRRFRSNGSLANVLSCCAKRKQKIQIRCRTQRCVLYSWRVHICNSCRGFLLANRALKYATKTPLYRGLTKMGCSDHAHQDT